MVMFQFIESILLQIIFGAVWAVIYLFSNTKIKLYSGFRRPDLDRINQLVRYTIKDYDTHDYIFCLDLAAKINILMKDSEFTYKDHVNSLVIIYGLCEHFSMYIYLADRFTDVVNRFVCIGVYLIVFFVSYFLVLKLFPFFKPCSLPWYDENTYPCFHGTSILTAFPDDLSPDNVTDYLVDEYNRIAKPITIRKQHLAQIRSIIKAHSSINVAGILLDFLVFLHFFIF